MEHFNFLSYEYYQTFYSYKGYFKKLWINLLLAGITSIIFIFTFLDLILVAFNKEGLINLNKNNTFWLVILAEIICIPCIAWLNSKKEKQTISNISKILKSSKNTLTDLKKEWLLKTFQEKPQEYIFLAESVIKGYEIINKNQRPFEFTRGRFYKAFYDNSAKPRILSLIIVLVSIGSILLLKQSNSLEIIFKEIYYTPTNTLLFLICIYTLFFKLTLMTVKYISMIVFILIESSSVHIDKKNKTNEYISKILINDLVKYSKLKLNKIKIKQN